MTAPEPTTETTTGPDESPAAATEPTTETEDSGNREAAKYRTKLRETESERDKLRGQVEDMQRAAVEEMARRDHRLSKPAALWKAGVELADLLNEDGQVDPEKVKTSVAGAIADLGLVVERSGNHVPSEGRDPGSPSASKDTWHAFLAR